MWIRFSAALTLFAIACSDTAAPSPDAGALPIERGQSASAEASRRDFLRLVQWNIKSARDSSLTTIAARLAELEADVIVLQEVDSGTRRSGGVDQPSALAAMLGFDYAFAPVIPWDGGRYGIATLSKLELKKARRIALTNAFAVEPRAALDTTLCLDRACLRVINHHADVVHSAAVQSTKEVLQDIEADLGSGVALAGDLNQLPTTEGPEALLAAGLVDLGAKNGAATTEHSGRIDYIFADTLLARCARTEPESASDHNSQIVDFDRSCLPTVP